MKSEEAVAILASEGRAQVTLKSKDTQFAVVKLPKCLEGPHDTYDRSTNSSRLQHRSRSKNRDGHSSTHDTREGRNQKRIHGATIFIENRNTSKHSPIDMTRLSYPFGAAIHYRSVAFPDRSLVSTDVISERDSTPRPLRP